MSREDTIILQMIKDANSNGKINKILREINFNSDSVGDDARLALFEKTDTLEDSEVSTEEDTFSEDFEEDLSNERIDREEEEELSQNLYPRYSVQVERLKSEVKNLKLQQIHPVQNVFGALNEELKRFKVRISKFRKKINSKNVSNKGSLIERLNHIEKNYERLFKEESPRIIKQALDDFNNTHKEVEDKSSKFDTIFPIGELLKVVGEDHYDGLLKEILNTKMPYIINIPSTNVNEEKKLIPAQESEKTTNKKSEEIIVQTPPDEDEGVVFRPDDEPVQRTSISLVNTQSGDKIPPPTPTDNKKNMNSIPENKSRQNTPKPEEKINKKTEAKPRSVIGIVGFLTSVFYRIYLWLKGDSGSTQQPKKVDSKPSNNVVTSKPNINKTQTANTNDFKLARQIRANTEGNITREPPKNIKPATSPPLRLRLMIKEL